MTNASKAGHRNGGNMWTELLEERMHDEIDRDAEVARILIRNQRWLKNDVYGPQWLVDAIGQPHLKWSLPETFAFSIIWGDIQCGNIIVARFPFGETPCADADLEENRRRLQHLGPLFRAFAGRGYDNDGCIEWEGMPELGAKGAPLEIGSSLATRTWGHLSQALGVVRWPYGGDGIVLLRRKIPLIYKIMGVKPPQSYLDSAALYDKLLAEKGIAVNVEQVDRT